jgi:hypothetical protein
MDKSEKLIILNTWVKLMPDKMLLKYENIYIANIIDSTELNEIQEWFMNKKKVLSNLLFDINHIAKSAYTFDLILFFDINEMITKELLMEYKTNILNTKGEIWIVCDSNRINNDRKDKYILNMLNETNLRSSLFTQNENMKTYIIK